MDFTIKNITQSQINLLIVTINEIPKIIENLALKKSDKLESDVENLQTEFFKSVKEFKE